MEKDIIRTYDPWNWEYSCYIEIVKEGGLSCTKQNKWLVIS